MTLHPSRVAHSFQEEFGGRFEGKRVMVTGATGFVGTNLCRALRTVGAQVTGVALADSLLHAPDPALSTPGFALPPSGPSRDAVSKLILYLRIEGGQ